MATKLHFSRFEFKYILPKAKRDDLESELQYFIELDPFVQAAKRQKYHVRSLYFDNDSMSCYYDNLDGIMHRSKFRLRTYSSVEDLKTPQFLELKGRYNALVFKHRTQLSVRRQNAGDATSRFSFDTTADILKRIEAGDLRSRFTYEVLRKNLKPVILIDYQRRPYVSKYDPEFRLTFDDSLIGCASAILFPGPREASRGILNGCTILEVKFRHHVPKWFHRIIQAFELRRVSISKYCAGVEAYKLAPKLE